MRKVDVIIQARMGSQRLPGKVLKDLCGKSVLDHIVQRVKQAKTVQRIIIATTTLTRDDCIVQEAQRMGVKYFRGSENNVLSRYYMAAKEFESDVIVRITADCPFVDPHLIDQFVMEFLKDTSIDYLSNAGIDPVNRTFPRGLDVEVFSMFNLQNIFHKAKVEFEKEHVTPYFYLNPDDFECHFLKNDKDYSRYRLTLDTPEDFELIKKIYEKLYRGEHDFYLPEIIEVLQAEPELSQINVHIENKINMP